MLRKYNSTLPRGQSQTRTQNKYPELRISDKRFVVHTHRNLDAKDSRIEREAIHSGCCHAHFGAFEIFHEDIEEIKKPKPQRQ